MVAVVDVSGRVAAPRSVEVIGPGLAASSTSTTTSSRRLVPWTISRSSAPSPPSTCHPRPPADEAGRDDDQVVATLAVTVTSPVQPSTWRRLPATTRAPSASPMKKVLPAAPPIRIAFSNCCARSSAIAAG